MITNFFSKVPKKMAAKNKENRNESIVGDEDEEIIVMEISATETTSPNCSQKTTVTAQKQARIEIKKKYTNCYLTKWELDFAWLASVTGSNEQARCKWCKEHNGKSYVFSVKSMGYSACERHQKSKRHQKSIECHTFQQTLVGDEDKQMHVERRK